MAERLSEIWSELEVIAAEEHLLALGAADITAANGELFREWLAAGHHGSMSYLERAAAVRENPLERFPWARSAVVILVPYAPGRSSEETIDHAIARYAQGEDYHLTLDRILIRMEERLHQLAAGARSWRYVDTGPLSDRALARAAGLGWIGKNAMLINQRHGSWTFIGVLLTSLVNDVAAEAVTDRCGSCVRCIEACPTDAILPNRTVDSNRCISHATIEQRGRLDDSMKERLGNNIFGCDICQEVCPWNRQPPAPHPAFATRSEYRATPVSDLLRLDQSGFSTLFRKSAVKRAKRAGMIRNALLVLPEVSSSELDRLEQEESDEGILDAIRWRRSR
jgi:epoxyqueuosine reductase